MPTSPESVIQRVDAAIDKATDGRLSRAFDTWGECINYSADEAKKFAVDVLDETYTALDSLTGGLPTAFANDLNAQIDRLIYEATVKSITQKIISNALHRLTTPLDRLARRAQYGVESGFLTLTAPLVTLTDDVEELQPLIAQGLADVINRTGAGPVVKRFLQKRGFGKKVSDEESGTVANNLSPSPTIGNIPTYLEPETEAQDEIIKPSILYVRNWGGVGVSRESFQNQKEHLDVNPALDLDQAFNFLKMQEYTFVVLDLVPNDGISQEEINQMVADFVRKATLPRQIEFDEDRPSQRGKEPKKILIPKLPHIKVHNFVYLSLDQPRIYTSPDRTTYELIEDKATKIIRGNTLALDSVVRLIRGENIPVLRPIQPENTDIIGLTDPDSLLQLSQPNPKTPTSSEKPSIGTNGKPLVVDWSRIEVDLRITGAFQCLRDIIDNRNTPEYVDYLNALFRVLEQMNSNEVELLEPEKLTHLWEQIKSGKLQPAVVTKIFD